MASLNPTRIAPPLETSWARRQPREPAVSQKSHPSYVHTHSPAHCPVDASLRAIPFKAGPRRLRMDALTHTMWLLEGMCLQRIFRMCCRNAYVSGVCIKLSCSRSLHSCLRWRCKISETHVAPETTVTDSCNSSAQK